MRISEKNLAIAKDIRSHVDSACASQFVTLPHNEKILNALPAEILQIWLNCSVKQVTYYTERGEEKLTIHPGDVLCLSSASLVQETPKNSGLIKIIIRPGYITVYDSLIKNKSWLDKSTFLAHQTHLGTINRITSVCKLLGWEASSKNFHLVMYIIGEVIEGLQKDDATKYNSKLNLIIIDTYINMNIMKSFNVKTIADEVHQTSSYINDIFKTTTNMPVFTHIVNKRMKLARNLVLTRNYTASMIGAVTGYPDRAHFGKIFKKHFGSTPMMLRKGGDRENIKSLNHVADRLRVDSYMTLQTIDQEKLANIDTKKKEACHGFVFNLTGSVINVYIIPTPKAQFLAAELPPLDYLFVANSAQITLRVSVSGEQEDRFYSLAPKSIIEIT